MAEFRIVDAVLLPVLAGGSLPHVVAGVGHTLELPLPDVLVPVDVPLDHLLR